MGLIGKRSEILHCNLRKGALWQITDAFKDYYFCYGRFFISIKRDLREYLL